MTINVMVNGKPRNAVLALEDACLVLHVDRDLKVAVDRREVRAGMNDLGVDVDRNMWWDGYNEALADAERAQAAGKPVLEWVLSVRRKFGLQSET